MLGWRICLRKGCQRRYRAASWNARYCQDPQCLRLVRRWQAAKRQQQRRATPEGRQRHAQAQRERRLQAAARSRAEDVRPARGHAAKVFLPHPFCNRPGCFEPPQASPKAPASYCGGECRKAVRRVRDRERKWLWRHTPEGRLKRQFEYDAARARRVEAPGHAAAQAEPLWRVASRPP